MNRDVTFARQHGIDYVPSRGNSLATESEQRNPNVPLRDERAGARARARFLINRNSDYLLIIVGNKNPQTL